MFGQVFHPSDLAIVALLVALEGLLSADNALVLAIMVKHLPPADQKKALTYGLGGAFIFRFVAILLAKFILQLFWLQAVGAIYLLVLVGKHFVSSSQGHEVKSIDGGFWRTVIAVEVADIAFAIDSVLAGVAMVKDATKLWVVFLGAFIGIVLLRIAASYFIRLLEKYPFLDHVAYLLVGWVGVKLVFLSVHNYGVFSNNPEFFPELPPLIFWIGMAIIGIGGGVMAVMKAPKQPPVTTE